MVREVGNSRKAPQADQVRGNPADSTPEGMRVKLREFAPLGSRVFHPHAHEPAKVRSLEGLFFLPSWACELQTRVPRPLTLRACPEGCPERSPVCSAAECGVKCAIRPAASGNDRSPRAPPKPQTGHAVGGRRRGWNGWRRLPLARKSLMPYFRGLRFPAPPATLGPSLPGLKGCAHFVSLPNLIAVGKRASCTQCFWVNRA
jgi:hypothetical protein